MPQLRDVFVSLPSGPLRTVAREREILRELYQRFFHRESSSESSLPANRSFGYSFFFRFREIFDAGICRVYPVSCVRCLLARFFADEIERLEEL